MNNDELLKKIAGLSPEQKEVLLKKLGYSSGRSMNNPDHPVRKKAPEFDCFSCDIGNPGSMNISFKEAMAADPPAGYVQISFSDAT
jgi:hypothetical protein